MPARQRLPMTGSAEPRPRTPPVVTFACGPPNPIFRKSYLRIRSTSGKLADRLEGRMSTGDSERACYGFGCEDMLLLKRTAKSSPLNYPGNLGRTCRRQIRHTANARTETFGKLATIAEGFIHFVWPQSEVGAHTALLLNAFVGLL